MSSTTTTALYGALERRADGWYWRDGTPEPRVRDMLLQDIAPNFRVVQGFVEFPTDWGDARHWPAGVVDDDARNHIARLLHEVGQRGTIYAEGTAELLDDHRTREQGWRIPVTLWDPVMRRQCGVWWDKADEASILARANELRGQGDGQ